MRVSLIIALIFSLSAFVIPFTSLPYQWNPFRQTLGWHLLAQALLDRNYDSKEDFLFSDSYQMASVLSFYSPEKERAYFFNLKGNRKNQFSYWSQLIHEKKKTGIFVISENTSFEDSWYKSHYYKELGKYFHNVEYLGACPLYKSEKKPLKLAFFFRCTNFLGQMPQDANMY